MKSGFKLGQILGIPIELDWSWFIIFLLVAWNLAGQVFPHLHPSWGIGLNWSLSLVGSLLFFVSVVAHELAHALVARVYGLPVQRIILFMFGGIANIEREPETPIAEFLITLAGPLVSLLLGGGFIMAGNFFAFQPQFDLPNSGSTPGIFATLCLWLGPVNIALGLFNLIPGFPLDGGRILRASLWALTNNLRQATYWAAGIGQAVGLLFILVGIVLVFDVPIPFFEVEPFSGLWFVVIGWFLSTTAAQSYRQPSPGTLEGAQVS